jgi:hypothetical protein
VRLITLEDPIEFEISGVCQLQQEWWRAGGFDHPARTAPYDGQQDRGGDPGI